MPILELSTLGLGGIIGGLVTLPAVGFAVVPAFEKEERRNVDLGHRLLVGRHMERL